MSAAALDDARAPELARYEAIYAHAELELQLAGRGEIESLIALDARWEELVAGLPEQPPPAAVELLQRARLMHERTGIELCRLRESLLGELGATAAGAAPPTATRAS